MISPAVSCDKCNSKENVFVKPFANRAVSPAVSTFLDKTFYKNLCTDCLQRLEEQVVRAARLHFPEKASELIEGTHYYMENGFFIFTELHHIRKGYCCGNGCRHCPYGFKTGSRK